MDCIWRCACKLHGRHLTTCHVQDPFFLLFIYLFFLPPFLFWAISEEPWSHLHTSLTVTHQSLIHHPAAKDEVTPTHRTGDRGARLCQSEPASLVSGTQSCAARPPAWQAAVSEDSPARCCCQKQATAGLIRPVTHPSSTCGRPWQLLHFPRADVKINKQSPCTSSRSSCNYVFPPSSPLLFLFHLLWGFGALIHPWRPRGTQPPTHQSTRPATITDQRRDVTMRLRIAFRYDNRSAVTDAPPVHALLQQLQPCRCAEAPCKHPAGEEGCSPRARVWVCFLPYTNLRGPEWSLWDSQR